MFFVGYLITALRWKILLATQGANPKIGFLIRSIMVGTFFNNLLPSTIGGDIIRIYDTRQLGINRSSATSVIIIDRLMGLLALSLFVLTTVLFSHEIVRIIPNLPILVVACVLILVLITLLIFKSPEWIHTDIESLEGQHSFLRILAKKIAKAFLIFNGRHEIFLQAFLLSLLLQFNIIVHFVVVS